MPGRDAAKKRCKKRRNFEKFEKLSKFKEMTKKGDRKFFEILYKFFEEMTKEGRRKFLGMPEPVLRPCLYSRIDSIPASRKRVVETRDVFGDW